MSAPHVPVLLAEVLAELRPQPGDVIVDATFGAGGYTRAFLDSQEKIMPRIVLIAKVDDPVEWEKRYLSHGELFRKVWPEPMPDVHYHVTDDSVVAMCMDVDDVEGWFEMLGSPEIASAMKEDGVQRETVQVYVLDEVASF